MPIPTAPGAPDASPQPESARAHLDPAPVPAIDETRPPIDAVPGIAAMVLPGLGHIVRGERHRGGLIMGGILALFFGGILIGGIDTIDRREDGIWFLGQAMVGPLAFGIDYVHQTQFKVRDPATGVLRSANPGETRGPGGVAVPAPPGTPPPNIKSIGRMNELGTLFSAIAGMMNLIVILDAVFPGGRRRKA